MQTNEGKVLVVIPSYNEAGRIGAVVRDAKRVLPEATVAVVDDNSSDETAREAAAAGAVVLGHSVNLGYGAGLETGYLYAAAKGYEIVAQMDGDGQHLAEELPKIVAPVAAGEADLVIGSRHLGGGCGYRTPFLRRLGQRIFGGIVRIFTGRDVTDPTSGFQCLGARTVRFFSSGIFPTDFPDADVQLMAHYAGLKAVEVPVRMVQRLQGTSMHSGLKPVYYGMKMFLAIFLVVLSYRRWRRHASEADSGVCFIRHAGADAHCQAGSEGAS